MGAAARSGGSPYSFGASFLDTTTGLRFEVHHPQGRPDLWKRYLDGAEARYAKHGIAPVLGRDRIEDGRNVSLFFVGFDKDGNVAAGVRAHGPLEQTSACQALGEMAASSEIDMLAATVERNLPYGVIELKGAWGALNSGGLHTMGLTLARCTSHALTWLRAELALGGVATRLQKTAERSGARLLSEESVPFPSERYRTVLLGWRRSQVLSVADPAQAELLRIEADQLLGAAASPAAVTEIGSDQRTEGWRPIVLDTRNRAHRQIVDQVRRDPTLLLVDRLASQREELAALLPPCPIELTTEPPRQVFYPWRNTMISVLGPEGFSRLRLDRNRNRITSDEQLRLRNQKVGVVGLSVGHSVAHTIAMEGIVGELRLADFDSIEVSNLNRIPASLLDVGVNKAVVAARRIAEIDPYLDVRVFTEGVTAENVEDFVEGLDVLVDECDSIAVKVLLREVAKAKGIPVLMETSDRGLVDVERFDLEPERPIFHGLLGELGSEEVAAMAPEAQLALVLRIVDASEASARGAASLAEIGLTLSTWPQLGGDVTLGAASMTAAIRRLGRGEPLSSGRIRIDLEDSLTEIETPKLATEPTEDLPDGTEYRSVPADDRRAIAHAASLAPSGANCQPWRFEIDEELRIYLDPSKSVTMDVGYRGSYVALGAALFNARVAAASRGLLGEHAIFPSGQGPADPVATLRLGNSKDPELAGWYRDVLARTTNRQKGSPSVVDEATRLELARQTEAEGGRLHLLADPEDIARCAQLLAESERIRFLTLGLHEEMLGELSWPGLDSLDTGIDVRTLELSPTELGLLGVVRRGDVMRYLADWGAGQALGMSAYGAVMGSSAVALVSVEGREPKDYVQGGMAVERAWLAAERAGFGVSPVSPIYLYAREPESYTELVGGHHAARLAELSGQFCELFGVDEAESMLLVMRLSRSARPSYLSRRLPLDEVTRGLGGDGAGAGGA